MKINRNLLVLAVLVLLVAAVAVAAVLRPAPAAQEDGVTGDMVVITVDGEEYARVPLSEPQTVTIEQESGEVNVVEISDHGAVMTYSSCSNQTCVKMGEVTLDNWEIRPNQQFIICLPNRVTVELVPAE